MSTDIFSHEEPQPVVASSNTQDWRRFLWVVPLAMAAATFANVVFYFVLTEWIGEPLLMPAQFPPPLMAPMK